MRALLINPNTRSDLTQALLQRLAPTLAAAGHSLQGETAAFGHDYIASEVSYVIASHAAIDAWQRHVERHGEPDAVLVACFGDPGVWALRELTQAPVIGLAEAALREAAMHGPFGIVTGGPAWRPMLLRLATGWGLGGPAGLRDVATVAANGGELAADPAAGAAQLDAALDDLLRRCAGLGAVVLGGAALGDIAARLRPRNLPLIDSIEAGARWLAKLPHSRDG